MRRLKQVGNHTIVGASGDLSDFQHISHMLDDLVYVTILLQVSRLITFF